MDVERRTVQGLTEEEMGRARGREHEARPSRPAREARAMAEGMPLGRGRSTPSVRGEDDDLPHPVLQGHERGFGVPRARGTRAQLLKQRGLVPAWPGADCGRARAEEEAEEPSRHARRLPWRRECSCQSPEGSGGQPRCRILARMLRALELRWPL
ncbi:unnamed protein product [Prorocentrum cordatum]|uniref:Uncharacterized protein n=1 Tax=Prorocentrum cordatum TaxID=2364126 RepID=A0ABN9WTK8_9DINO|nr:unnamed protein product [Polarella glacialis]